MSENTTSQNPFADYYAAKEQVMAALTAAGATSVDTAVTAEAAGLTDDTAFMVASRGAEVRYRRGAGYFLGRVHHNGRGL